MSTNSLVSAGAQIGAALLIRYLFPPEGPIDRFGPRLDDLRVTSSVYGTPIKVGSGVVRMGGQIIWSTGLIETINTQEIETGGGGAGKGGSDTASITTYTYAASFAIAFSAGVADDVLRMWADGQLIYDKTGEAGVAIFNGDLKFTFYHGDEDQLPDPLMEAALGAGNVSAHRGLCYLVAENWPLANYGNRLPQLTAEIAYTADGNHFIPFTVLEELDGSNVPGSSSGSDTDSHMFLDAFSDGLWFFKVGTNGMSRSSVSDFKMKVQVSTGAIDAFTFRPQMDGFIWGQAGSNNFQSFEQYEPWSLQKTGKFEGGSGVSGVFGLQGNYPNGTYMGILPIRSISWPGEVIFIKVFVAKSALEGNGGMVVVWEDYDIEQERCVKAFTDFTELDIGRGGPVLQMFHEERLFFIQENDTEFQLYEVYANLERHRLKPPLPERYCYFTTNPSANIVGTYAKGGEEDPYTSSADTTGWCFLPNEDAVILSNGDSMVKIDLGGVALAGGPILAQNPVLGFHSEDQWSVSGKFGFGNGKEGQTDGGLTFIISTDTLQIDTTEDLGLMTTDDGEEANYEKGAWDDRSQTLIFSRQNATTPSNDERIVRILPERESALGFPTSLDLVVADLCNRAGLETTDYDVSALASQPVRGFVVTRQGSVRSALEPLQQGFLFEGVESDWIVKFVPRGGAPVLTIPADDIGRLGTEATDEFVQEIRVQEVELPETMRIAYSDYDNDYQSSVQYDKRVSQPSPAQYSNNTITLNLPIVFNASEAKQIAQRWLYTSWAERLNFNTTIPWKYLRLDPTDVITVIYQNENRRLRLSEVEVGAGLDINFKSTQEDANSHLSGLIGDSGQGFLAQQIPSGLPTRLFLMDLPLLTQEDATFNAFQRGYWAVSGYEDSWRGATLYQSLDFASSFNAVGTAIVESSWGIILGTIPDAATTERWDESATIDIRVIRGIAGFVSSTDIQVLNGANAIAVINEEGLPEIIQFVTVTVIAADVVRLSRLLRGRRGTEEHTGLHGIAETVVLLGTDSTYRLTNELSRINTQLHYRIVTNSTYMEDARVSGFNFLGQDLIPYSVQNITSNLRTRFRASTDAVLSWLRRTRHSGEMRDFKDLVPINETTLDPLFEIEYRFGGVTIIERLEATDTEIVELTTDIVTVAEFTALSHPDGPPERLLLEGEVYVENADFELGVVGEEPTGWTENGISNAGGIKISAIVEGPTTVAKVGTYFMWMGEVGSARAEMYQDIDLVALGWDVDQLDIDQPTVELKYWHVEVRATHDDLFQAIVEMRDANGNNARELNSGQIVPVQEDTWEEVTLNAPWQPGTRSFRIVLRGFRFGTGLDTAEGGFDNIRLRIGDGVPPLQANIYQLSAQVGRGRSSILDV